MPKQTTALYVRLPIAVRTRLDAHIAASDSWKRRGLLADFVTSAINRALDAAGAPVATTKAVATRSKRAR